MLIALRRRLLMSVPLRASHGRFFIDEGRAIGVATPATPSSPSVAAANAIDADADADDAVDGELCRRGRRRQLFRRWQRRDAAGQRSPANRLRPLIGRWPGVANSVRR